MRKLAVLLMVGSLSACASVQSAPRTEPGANVPLVQIQNDTYSEAVISIDGTRFAEVQGGKSVLVSLSPARIKSNGEIHFTARLVSLDETIELPVVQYEPGRKIRIALKPMLSASTAQ